MRIIHCQQRSPEWDAARLGAITASRMDDVFAREGAKKRQAYLHDLSLDFQGVGRFDFDEAWAEHGRANEPRAILAYEWRYGVQTWNDCVLAHNDFDWLRCSPDILVGPREAPTKGAEVKSRSTLHTFLDAKHGREGPYQGLARGYYLQIQTALAITGWESWEYVNFFCNDRVDVQELSVREVYRDDEIIDEILERSVAFRIAALKAAERMAA